MVSDGRSGLTKVNLFATKECEFAEASVFQLCSEQLAWQQHGLSASAVGNSRDLCKVLPFPCAPDHWSAALVFRVGVARCASV